MAVLILIASIAFASSGLADGEEDATKTENPDVAAAPPSQAPRPELPRFVPPSRGAPGKRVGGATRGTTASQMTRVEVLVPEQTGLTLKAQPILYFYLSEETGGRVDLTLNDETSIEPLLETTLKGPLRKGVNRIRLGDFGLKLRTGVTYEWFVALIIDPERRSSDVLAGGTIQRQPLTEELRSTLDAAGAERKPFTLASAGIWYDAIDALSERIDAAPDDLSLRQQRAALLEQVGLAEVARADLAQP